MYGLPVDRLPIHPTRDREQPHVEIRVGGFDRFPPTLEVVDEGEVPPDDPHLLGLVPDGFGGDFPGQLVERDLHVVRGVPSVDAPSVAEIRGQRKVLRDDRLLVEHAK